MAKSLPKKDPAPFKDFLKHFTRNFSIGITAGFVILFIGMIGLRYLEGNSWSDAYVNSAMIVSGVGTLTNPKTESGKLFVGTYSIIGGGSFLLIVAVVFAPIFHWFFRQVHVEDREHFK
jgi:hypothetical protein